MSHLIFILGALFGGQNTLECEDSGDNNDDGAINLADAIALLDHLFGMAGPLPDPMNCGVDPTADALGCDMPAGCP